MYEELKNKTILVTGSTGLIGQSLVKRLLFLGSNVVLVVRDYNKARSLFGESESINYIVSDVKDIKAIDSSVDYIVHAAANTTSSAFINTPVEVINNEIEGTKNTLNIARNWHVKGYVYLSSMEVYGTPSTDEKIDENHCSNLNTMVSRSCYPESKRLCECLCASYFAEYDVPVKVVRLTQTFGPGVQYNDCRVFAEFARAVIEERDIVLHTQGQTKRSYLYIDDAINAILIVLVNGISGEAYNAANEDTYCSIRELADLFASKSNLNKTSVIFDLESDASCFGYAPTLHMNLNSNKLRELGWKPRVSLSLMIDALIESMKKNN